MATIARKSATVILTRERATSGFEVFLLRRTISELGFELQHGGGGAHLLLQAILECLKKDEQLDPRASRRAQEAATALREPPSSHAP